MENFAIFDTHCISLNQRITANINTLEVLKLQFDMKKNVKLIKVNWSKPLQNTFEEVNS